MAHASTSSGSAPAVVLALLLSLPVPGVGRGDDCLGDCTGRRGVGADDLLAGVHAIFDPAAGACVAALDRDPDGRITAAELVAALRAAQSGCGEAPAFCAAIAAPLGIPDDDEAGVSSDIVIAADAEASTLSTSVRVTHTWVGDLVMVLTHVESGAEVVLLDRPGAPANPVGCAGDDVDCVFADGAARAAEDGCDETPPALRGALRPAEPLARFAGEPVAGTWRLRVADTGAGDRGALQGWCLELAGVAPPTPTATATAATSSPTAMRSATATRPPATATATGPLPPSATATAARTPTRTHSPSPTATAPPSTRTATPTSPPGGMVDLTAGGRVVTDAGAVVEVLPDSGAGVVTISATVSGSAGFDDERGTVVSREYDVTADGAAAAQISGALITLPVDRSVIDWAIDPHGFYGETFDDERGEWVTVHGLPRYDAGSGSVTFQAPHLSKFRLRLLGRGAPDVFLYSWTNPTGHFRIAFYCQTAEPCTLPADGQPSVRPLYPRADGDWLAVGGGHASDPEVPDYIEDVAQALEDGLTALRRITTSSGTTLFSAPAFPLDAVVTFTPDASGDSPLGGPLRLNARLADWDEMRTTAAHELVHVLADEHYTILGAVLNRWYFEAIANLWAARAATLSRAEAVAYYRREMSTYLRLPLTQSDEGSYYAAADLLDWLEAELAAPLAADVVAADYTRDIAGLSAIVAAHGTTLDDLFFRYATLVTVGSHDLRPGYLYEIDKGQFYRLLTPDQRGWRFEFRQFNHSVRALRLRTSIAAPGLLVAVAEREQSAAQRRLRTFSYAGTSTAPLVDVDAYLESGLAEGQPVVVKNFGAPNAAGVDATILDQIVVTGERYRPVDEGAHVFDFYFLEAPAASSPSMGRVTWSFDERGIPSPGLLTTPYVAGFNVYSRGARLNAERLDPAAREYESPELVDGCGTRVTVEDRYGNEWPEPAALQLAAPSGSTICCGQGAPCRLRPCATGGAIPHAWTLTAGTLPPGFALDATTGEVSGSVGTAEREFAYTLRVGDGSGATAAYAGSILHCGDFEGFLCTVACLY